jgi:hypothetical protein
MPVLFGIKSIESIRNMLRMDRRTSL